MIQTLSTPLPPSIRPISLDIETYGGCHFDLRGKSLPPQTVFHPYRSLKTDGANLSNLILSCSITEIQMGENHWDLSKWKPGNTRVFLLANPTHLKWLRQWIEWSNVILGMNLTFDVPYLRTLPLFKKLLTPATHHLVDLAVINYLDSEVRPERSLKAIAPLLGFEAYEEAESLKTYRYPNPNDKRFQQYNAKDSHVTVSATAELARRIQVNHKGSDKLSHECLRYYSESIWTCIGMGTVGIPASRKLLEAVERDVTTAADSARDSALTHDLILEGKGSSTESDPKSRYGFISRVCDTIDSLRPGTPTIRTDRRLHKTKAKKLVSFKDENRHYLSSLLPPGHDLLKPLELFDKFAKNQKLLSSYLFPLLHHNRSKEDDKSSILLRGKLYPIWYPVPTQAKDTSGDAGGTEQGRITAKKPAVQTFPKVIKSCITPPSGDWVIVWQDLSQIELRVASLLSGDAGMIRNYVDGLDLHTDRAIEIFGRDWLLAKCGLPLTKHNPKFDIYRQVGKTINFADLFLSSPHTMRATVLRDLGIDLPLDLFADIASRREKSRPGLYAWQQSLIAQAKRDHRLYLPIVGQSRYFQGSSKTIDETYLSTIVNFPVQTTAGTLMLRYQSLLNQLLPPWWEPSNWAHQFINIYDAVGSLVRRDRLEEFQALAKQAFTILRDADYWHLLQTRLGRTVPIAYDTNVVSSTSVP